MSKSFKWENRDFAIQEAIRLTQGLGLTADAAMKGIIAKYSANPDSMTPNQKSRFIASVNKACQAK